MKENKSNLLDVHLWENNQVMTFSRSGDFVEECCGPCGLVWEKVLKVSTRGTRFHLSVWKVPGSDRIVSSQEWVKEVLRRLCTDRNGRLSGQPQLKDPSANPPPPAKPPGNANRVFVKAPTTAA